LVGPLSYREYISRITSVHTGVMRPSFSLSPQSRSARSFSLWMKIAILSPFSLHLLFHRSSQRGWAAFFSFFFFSCRITPGSFPYEPRARLFFQYRAKRCLPPPFLLPGSTKNRMGSFDHPPPPPRENWDSFLLPLPPRPYIFFRRSGHVPFFRHSDGIALSSFLEMHCAHVSFLNPPEQQDPSFGPIIVRCIALASPSPLSAADAISATVSSSHEVEVAVPCPPIFPPFPPTDAKNGGRAPFLDPK